MRIPLLLVLILLVAGCTAPVNGEALETITRFCNGEPNPAHAENAQAPRRLNTTLEYSFVGTCWGSLGHHTYDLGKPAILHQLVAHLETNYAEHGAAVTAPAVTIAVSTDGVNWSAIKHVRYPVDEDGYQRHKHWVEWEGRPIEARFVRISMPYSSIHGLAGFVDSSKIRVEVSELAPQAVPARPTTFDCAAHMMERFYEEHPCWFAGVEEGLEHPPEQTGFTEPIHLGLSDEMPSFWNAPSFLHTYYHPADLGGEVAVSARMQPWRLGTWAGCVAAEAREGAEVIPGRSASLMMQASPDGIHWQATTASPIAGGYGETLQFNATIPDGTHFVRFGSAWRIAYDIPSCHHPHGYMTRSAFTYND